MNFTFIDLFSGIGGFHIASKNNGGECVGFSEISKDAIEYYCKNYGINANMNFGDITKVSEFPKFDFMTAGVPCQSWSIAGKRLGFDDDRGQLWNDTLYILNKCKPKAFLFENVKGLTDTHNKTAFNYILDKVKEAGYHATWKILNSYDFGSPQMRERVYIVGFKEESCFNKFQFPEKENNNLTLNEILTGNKKQLQSNIHAARSMSVNESGENDYYIFSDIRDGKTTIHTWDLYDTSDRQKHICQIILKNRRKSIYGPQDGNPLSLEQLRTIDDSITQDDLNILVNLKILRPVEYRFKITQSYDSNGIQDNYKRILELVKQNMCISQIKQDEELKKSKCNVSSLIQELQYYKYIECSEIRYEFKNSKISTGINGIYRIVLRSSNIFPTLVASDTNDFVATVDLSKNNKERFIQEIYIPGNFRKITKEEACKIQGYPEDFILPENRMRWMKLLGNSVTVPVIDKLVKSITDTGCFLKDNIQ